MKKKTLALAGTVFAATLTLAACDQVTEQLPSVDVNSMVDKLDQMAKQGAAIQVPSTRQIETIAKNTVCPALKRDSSHQTYQTLVTGVEREFGLTPETADLVVTTGAQIWCPSEFVSVEGEK